MSSVTRTQEEIVARIGDTEPDLFDHSRDAYEEGFAAGAEFGVKAAQSCSP